MDPYFALDLEQWPFEGSETDLVSVSCSSGSFETWHPDTQNWTVLPLECWSEGEQADFPIALIFGSELVRTYGAGLENSTELSVSVQAWPANTYIFSYATIRDGQSNALLLAAAMQFLSVSQPIDFDGMPVGFPVMVDGPTPEQWFSPFLGLALGDDLCPDTSPAPRHRLGV